MRELITHGCLFYAIWLIRTQGCKATAAARQAGFASYWNLNRQCKKYAGCTVGQCRDCFPFQLDIKEVLLKLEELRRITVGNGSHSEVGAGTYV